METSETEVVEEYVTTVRHYQTAEGYGIFQLHLGARAIKAMGATEGNRVRVIVRRGRIELRLEPAQE